MLNAPQTTQKSTNFDKKIFGHKNFFKVGNRAKKASIKVSAKIKEFKGQGKVFESADCESDLQRSMFFRIKFKSKSNQYDMVRELLEIYEEIYGKLPAEVIKKYREKKRKEKEERADQEEVVTKKRKLLKRKKREEDTNGITDEEETNSLMEAINQPLTEQEAKTVEDMGEREINDLLDNDMFVDK